MAVRLGEYLLERRIGSGGMGQVFYGKQESLDRPVAIKILPQETASDKQSLMRFQREAKAIARLIHPNIIQVFSFGVEKGVPYFAMEFVEGRDLGKRLKRGEEFTVGETARIFLEVTKALEAASQHDMVHRDIKPSNIMIANTGDIKVMDFGLAKTMKQRSDVTTVGMVLGTPQYMAPEQGRGEELDSRADMYSLGCVIYQVLTGTPPFTADNPTAMVYRHLHDDAAPIRDLNPEVPENLASIVHKCLAKNQEDRFPGPTALREIIEKYQKGEELAIPPPSEDGGPDSPAGHEKIPGKSAVPAEAASPFPAGKIWIPVLGGVGLFIAVAVFGLILFRRELFGPGEKPGGTTAGGERAVAATIIDPGELGNPPCEIGFPGDKLREYYGAGGRSGHMVKGTLIAKDGRSAPIELKDRLLCAGKYTLRLEREGFKSCEFEIQLYLLGDKKNSIEPDLKSNKLPLLEPTRETLDRIETALALYNHGRFLDAEMQFSELARIAPEIPARPLGAAPAFPDMSAAIEACKAGASDAKTYAGYKAEGQRLLGEAHLTAAIKAFEKIPRNSAYYLKEDIEGLITRAKDKMKSATTHILDARKELALGRMEEAKALASKAGELDGDMKEVDEILNNARLAAEYRQKAKDALAANDNREAHANYLEYLKIASSDSEVSGVFDHLDKLVKADIAREKEIEKRTADAEKAMSENRPADAIREYDYITGNLMPDKELSKHLTALREKAVTAKKKLGIENTLAELDRAYQARDADAVLALLTPGARVKWSAKRDVETFFEEAAAVKSSKHRVISLDLKDGREAAETEWMFSVLFRGVPETAVGAVKMTYGFVRTNEGWKISAISAGETDAKRP